MVFIVLVYWTVEEGSEEEFEKFWREKLVIKNRTALVGEFLSKVELPDGYNTWDLTRDGVTTYVNVGIWKSRDDFIGEVGGYISQRRGFEKKFRVRAMLAPTAWRLGECDLKTLKDQFAVSS